jgi:signal transduction histidine kinase
MKVAAAGVSDSIRATLEGWGWLLSDEDPDAVLTISGQQLEIRVGATIHADDIVFLPPNEAELKLRIELAQARRARLAQRLHDLRSPLNAIQGYAEIIAESAQGDALRFASNIRTASEILTRRLESLRDEGV